MMQTAFAAERTVFSFLGAGPFVTLSGQCPFPDVHGMAEMESTDTTRIKDSNGVPMFSCSMTQAIDPHADAAGRTVPGIYKRRKKPKLQEKGEES